MSENASVLPHMVDGMAGDRNPCSHQIFAALMSSRPPLPTRSQLPVLFPFLCLSPHVFPVSSLCPCFPESSQINVGGCGAFEVYYAGAQWVLNLKIYMRSHNSSIISLRISFLLYGMLICFRLNFLD